MKTVNILFHSILTAILAAALIFAPIAMSAPQGNAEPGLTITTIPDFGATSATVLRGRVANISSDKYNEYKLAVMVAIEGLGYFSKPFCNPLFAQINPDGTWSANIVTGGADQEASVIVVYLMRAGFQAPCVLGGSDLAIFDREAAAKVVIHRDNPAVKTLVWSGEVFEVRESSVPVDPGRNLFRAENAFVDESGRLHLRLRKAADGRWQAGEIFSRRILGRGRYIFYVESPADRLPPNATVGLYTFGLDPTSSHREIDVELGRFGNPSAMNSQFAIQPFTMPGNVRRFDLPAGQSSIHSFDWRKDRVDFRATTASGMQVQEWTYPNAVLQLADERLRFNLWSVFSSSNDPDIEVIISKFEFIPEAQSVISLSAANYGNSYGIARDSIVAAFGRDLATLTQAATGTPLPTMLGGVTVRVKDSAGVERLAPVFFVSPNQVNYLIPENSAPGVSQVTVISGNGATSQGTIKIIPVSPALFSADGNGQGPAAAVALRVKPDGSQQFEPVARLDPATGKFVTVPINLGPAGDKVFLVAYGTGIRRRYTLSTVKIEIGGRNAEVSYADKQGALAGLDQVNALIPRELQGRGDVEAALNADGQISNSVMINVR